MFDLVLVELHLLAVRQQLQEPAADLHPHVDGWQVLHLDDLAERIGLAVQVRFPEHHEIERSTAHGGGGQAQRRDEFTQQ
ncbi:hypothetical protein D3C87_1947510 [compost metagenome]